MHSHDLDQIAALADGSLAPHLQDDARELIAGCQECREEYDAQTSIIAILADTEQANLTELERARLHQTITKLEPAAPQRTWMNWMPRLAVAAAAVAFVGTFGVLFFGGGADQPSTDAVAAKAPAATAAVAEDQALDGGDAALSQLAPAAEVAEAGADEAAGNVERLLEDTRYAEIGELPDNITEVTEGFLWAYLINAESLTANDENELECLGAVEELGPLKLAATAEQNGDRLEIYLADGEVTVLDPEDCSELETP